MWWGTRGEAALGLIREVAENNVKDLVAFEQEEGLFYTRRRPLERAVKVIRRERGDNPLEVLTVEAAGSARST